MRSALYGGLAVVTLSLCAHAQIAPAIVKTVAATSSSTTTIPRAVPRFAPLGSLALGPAPGMTTTVQQIELRRIGTTNNYRVGATVAPGPAVLTGTGPKIVEGVYNAATEVFSFRMSGGTLTTVNLNLPGNEFSLSITNDGLTCVFDDLTGQVPMWSRRAVDGAVWPAPKPIMGIPTGGSHFLGDSKIFLSNRDPVTGNALPAPRLMYAGVNFATSSQGNILVADFVVTGSPPNEVATLQNLRGLFLNSTFNNGDPHSIHPIDDGNGNVFAWLLNANLDGSGDDDAIFVPYINAAHGYRVVYDDPNAARLNNGTSIGPSGSWLFAHDQAPTSALGGDPFAVCTVSVNGDTWPAATGGPVRLRAMVPWDDSATWAVQLWLGPPLAATPIAIPPTLGNKLGFVGSPRPPGELGVQPLILLPSIFVPPSNPGGATYAFGVPAVTGSLTVQVIGVNFSTGQIYLGNTATLSSR